MLSMVAETVALYGKLDIMVNNSGGARNQGRPENFTYQGWLDEIALNLSSVFLGSQTAAKVMIEQGHGGKIINISSKAGSSGQTTMVGYGASKAGVNNLTEVIILCTYIGCLIYIKSIILCIKKQQGLANSWARHSINVNVVAPGLTATPGATYTTQS